MAKLTKEQKRELERQSLWADAYALAASMREQEEARRQAEDEAAAAELAANPWSNVISGASTYTPEGPSPWAAIGDAALDVVSPTARVSSDQLRGVGRSLVDIAANVTDALAPDANPVAFANARAQGRDPWAVEQTAEDATDIGLGMLSTLRNVADWAGQTEVLDSVLPGFSTVTAAAQAAERQRMNVSATEMAVRDALGEPSFEQMRQGSMFNRAADSLRELSEGMQSDASQARGQRLSSAMDEGFAATAGFLASREGLESLGEDLLPGSLPYMAGGMGVSAGLRAAGLSSGAAAVGGATAVSFTTTLANAQDAENAVRSLSPEALAATPRAAELLAQGQDINHVREVLAREARMKAISSSVLISPASVVPALNPLERIAARAGANPLSTSLQRATLATLAGIGGEAVQEGGEALQANVGEVAAGVRDTSDLMEGVAGAALVGAGMGGPIAGAAGYADARADFSNRAAALEDVATRLDERRENRAQARFEEETMARLRAAEEARVLDEARRSFTLSGPIPTTDGIDNAGRTTESFEAWAAREGAEQTAADQAAADFIGWNTLESSNAALRNSLREGPRGVNPGPRLDDAAMAAENERWASAAETDQAQFDGPEAAQRAFLGWNTLESSNAAAQNALREGPRGVNPGRRFSNKAQAAENERWVRGMANEELEQAAFEEEAMARLNDREAQAAEAAERERVAAEQRAAFEADIRDLDTKGGQADLKRAQQKHRADRRAHLEAVRKANATRPTEERVQILADAAQAWDAANPAPTAENVAAAVQAAPAPRRRGQRTAAPAAPAVDPAQLAAAGMTADEIAAAQAAPVQEDVSGRIEALRNRRQGRADSTPVESTGRTAGDVVRDLARRVAKGNNRVALAQEQLLMNGKLSVVDKDVMNEVAGGPARGYYDGERMYINADVIPEGEVAGHIFNEILAHEADHAARISENRDAKSKVRILLGDTATEKLLDQLYDSNHPTAVAARDMVARAGITEEEDIVRFEDELTAYAISQAMADNATAKWAPIRGLVSAARRKWKDFTGSDDLNLDDLAVYAQRTIDALATSEQGIGAVDATDGRQMVVGPNARNWEQMDNRYRGRVDGMERAEISDALAEIDVSDDTLIQMLLGERKSLEDFLSHSSLFDNYPQLRNRGVSVVNLGREIFGGFDGRNLVLDAGLVERAATDPVEAEFLRRVVLHEVQHAVQQIEGFVGGANTDDFIQQNIKEDYNFASSAFERTFNDFNLQQAVNSLSPEDKALWQQEARDWAAFNDDIDPRSDDAMRLLKRKFLNDNWGALSTNQIIKAKQQKYDERKAALGPARDAYNAALDVAFSQYQRVYGETEARNTEFRSRMSEDDIRVIPPEDTMGFDGSEVTVDQTTSVKGAPTRVARSEGRAPTDGREISPESVVRDANGRPLTVYHGTSNPFDEFAAGRGGSVTGAASARQGFFFTDRRKTAEYYSKADGTSDATRRVEEAIAKAKGQQPRNFGPRVIEANLNITNPLVYDFKGKVYREETYNDLITRAKSEGNDGVILRNTFDAGETSRMGALLSGRISPETIYVAFSPEQIVPVQREGRASAVAPRTTAPYQPEMNSRWKQAMKKVPDPILNAFTVAGAAGKGMFNLSQDAENARNAVYQQALSYNARLDKAFDKAAKAKGISKKELNDTIMKRLEAIAAIPNVVRKDTLIARIAQDYPELKSLVEAIQQINMQTDAIIDARLADPREISEEELANLEYMDRNKYTYLTNMYAAFQGKAGKDYKNKLLEHYEKAKALVDAGKEIPDNIRREYDVYSKALRWVVANDVAVSDPEQLAALPIEDLEGLYDMWSPERDTARDLRTRMSTAGDFDVNAYRDFMSDWVAEWVGEADTATIENLGNSVLQALLNNQPVSGPAKRYGRGGGLDDTILQHRKEVPKELADLYGKVTDIPALVNATLTRQGELAERMRFFNRMREEVNERGMPYVVSQREAAEQFPEYSVRLSGKSYGAVDGMYTTPEIARSIDDYTQETVTLADTLALVGSSPSIARKFAGQKWFETWTKLAGLQKAAKIITRPDYVVMNAAGSIFTPILTGGVSFSDYARGVKVVAEHMSHTINPGKDENISRDLKLALEMGLFDNAVTQEIRQAPRKMVEHMIREMTQATDLAGVRTAGDKLTGAAKVAWNSLVELYSMSDAWAKIPVGLRRIEYLDNYYRANGDDVTNEQIVREAAAFVRDSTIGMQAVPAGVKLGERLGLTFYAPYFYSAFRALGRAPINAWNDAKMAMQAKTPEARNIAAVSAATKAAGVGITLTAMTGALKQLADDLMDDDEREQAERDRALMFPGDAAGDVVYLGKDDAGRRLYFNLSRIDQWGPATDIYRALRSAPEDESAAKIVAESMIDLIIMNRAIGVILNKAAGKEKSTQLERVLEEQAQQAKDVAAEVSGRVGSAEFGYEAMDTLLDVADLFTPAGVMNYLDPNNTRPQEMDSKARSMIGGLMSALGHKFVAVDEKQSLGMAARELSKHRQDANSRVRDALATRGPQAGLEAHLREARKEQQLVADLGRKWEAVVGGDTSVREAQAMLKESNLDATTISNIRKQAYTAEADDWARRYSRILTERSSANVPFSRRVLSPEEQKEREKEWKRQAKEVRRRLRARSYSEENRNGD